MKHPKRIEQADTSGCGIACVACLASVSYVRAKRVASKLFEWHQTKRSGFYTDFDQLSNLLAEFEIKAGKRKVVKKWSSLPSLAIVAINPDENYYKWHWVVFSRNEDGDVVLDPRSKAPERRDFNRMKLWSFIAIEE